jgi:hypothetical protein
VGGAERPAGAGALGALRAGRRSSVGEGERRPGQGESDVGRPRSWERDARGGEGPAAERGGRRREEDGGWPAAAAGRGNPPGGGSGSPLAAGRKTET